MVENVTGTVRVSVRRFTRGPIVKHVCVRKEPVMETIVNADLATLVTISLLDWDEQAAMVRSHCPIPRQTQLLVN